MKQYFSVLLSLYYKESPTALYLSLNSLFTQSLLPTEIILVKDGPLTDELEAVLKVFEAKYSILKIIPLAQNQGLGKALNEGLKHCSYDIIARMDTDDIAKPNRFEKQLEIFRKHPEVDVVGSWIDEFEGETTNIKSIRKLPQFHEDIVRFAKMRNPINHPTVMFRKKAVLAAGGYQHFPLFEDYYLWVRMLINGAKFYNIQESLLWFRSSPNLFKRRGGLRYAKDEYHFLQMMYRIDFISQTEFVRNISVRFATRVIPNELRGWVYKKILRK